jgi:hypothetical protein
LRKICRKNVKKSKKVSWKFIDNCTKTVIKAVQKLTITTVIVIVVVDIIYGRREQQIQFLFEREHFAVDVRAICLQTLRQIVFVVLKERKKL